MLYRLPEYEVTAKTLGEAIIQPLAGLPQAFVADIAARQPALVMPPEASIMIRPEDISIVATGPAASSIRLKAQVASVVYRGDQYRMVLSIPELGQTVMCTIQADDEVYPLVGSETEIFIDFRKIRIVRGSSTATGLS